jgi:hypothetical protein
VSVASILIGAIFAITRKTEGLLLLTVILRDGMVHE